MWGLRWRADARPYIRRVTTAATVDTKAARTGLVLGIVGVTIFALTLPMTRMAVGDASAPQLSPAFVTVGRAALAGVLAACWLWFDRSPRPLRSSYQDLTICALGTVFGFPWALAMALRDVPAVHAAVITGLLPLGTAVVGAVWLRQKASLAFWVCAVAGAILVVVYAWLESGGHWTSGDLWLLLSVASASIGYVAGSRAAKVLGSQRTISWVLVASLPLTMPMTLLCLPQAPVPLTSWLGFLYVSLFSMWIGFFAWYRALAVGGVMRVSQVQLLQPFITLFAAVPILGETLTLRALGFAGAVALVVVMARKSSR